MLDPVVKFLHVGTIGNTAHAISSSLFDVSLPCMEKKTGKWVPHVYGRLVSFL